MPKVTVVPEDKIIIVDGLGLVFEFEAPADLHALQWDGEKGHKELSDMTNVTLAEGDYDSEVAPFVSMWLAEKQRIDEIEAEKEAEANLLPNVKARKLDEIKAAADATLAPLSAAYPYNEVLFFADQEKEARALVEDTSASAPLLTAIAAGRGIGTTELALKVIAKADATRDAVGKVIGESQKDKDRLAAAQTAEEVAAIVPDYSLPESTVKAYGLENSYEG